MFWNVINFSMAYVSRYDAYGSINKQRRRQFPVNSSTSANSSPKRKPVFYSQQVESRNQFQTKSKKNSKIIPYEIESPITKQLQDEDSKINQKRQKNQHEYIYGNIVFNKKEKKGMHFIGKAKNNCSVLFDIENNALVVVPNHFIRSYNPSTDKIKKKQKFDPTEPITII